MGNNSNLSDELSLRIKPQIKLAYEVLRGTDPDEDLPAPVVRNIEAVLFIALDLWRDLEDRDAAVRKMKREGRHGDK